MERLLVLSMMVLAAMAQSTAPPQSEAPRRATGTPAGSLLLHVAFADAKRGLVVGGNGESDPGIVLATADGGESWNSRDGVSRHRLYDVAFASADVAVAVGLGGTIVRSGDGGATWQRVREAGGWLAGVAFADATRGFAVGHAVGEERLFLRSDDGGATWRDAPGLPEAGAKATLRAIEFRDAKVGVAVGSGGLVLVTTDGGEQWSARAPAGIGDAYLRALCFQGETLWIAGEHGLLLRSEDLAATVTWITVPDDGKLMGVAFATAQLGWTTTMGGRLLATSDGGASWTAIAQSDADALAGVALRPDGALAVAVGGGGTIVLPAAVARPLSPAADR